MMRKTIAESRGVTSHVVEVYQAVLRAGGSPTHAMKWLLEFAQRDLSLLSEGDWLNLSYEVIAFARFGLLKQPHQKTLVRRNARSSGLITTSPEWEDITEDVTLPSKDEIAKLRRFTWEQIEAIVQKDVADIDVGHIRIRLKRIPPTWVYTRLIVDLLESGFAFHLAHHFADQAAWIRRCPECTKYFLAERRNQLYCSSSCQTRMASRKYRATPPERVGKRGRPPKKERPAVKAHNQKASSKGGQRHGAKRRA